VRTCSFRHSLVIVDFYFLNNLEFLNVTTFQSFPFLERYKKLKNLLFGTQNILNFFEDRQDLTNIYVWYILEHNQFWRKIWIPLYLTAEIHRL
jgi:hypothetical protein